VEIRLAWANLPGVDVPVVASDRCPSHRAIQATGIFDVYGKERGAEARSPVLRAGLFLGAHEPAHLELSWIAPADTSLARLWLVEAAQPNLIWLDPCCRPSII
jgi:hypothetical protein